MAVVIIVVVVIIIVIIIRVTAVTTEIVSADTCRGVHIVDIRIADITYPVIARYTIMIVYWCGIIYCILHTVAILGCISSRAADSY